MAKLTHKVTPVVDKGAEPPFSPTWVAKNPRCSAARLMRLCEALDPKSAWPDEGSSSGLRYVWLEAKDALLSGKTEVDPGDLRTALGRIKNPLVHYLVEKVNDSKDNYILHNMGQEGDETFSQYMFGIPGATLTPPPLKG